MKTFAFVLAPLLTLNAPVAEAQTPRSAEDYNNRGLERQRQGDLDAAYQSKGNLDAAIRDFTEALARAPEFTDAYVNRGQARQAQQNLEGAISDYDRAIELKGPIRISGDYRDSFGNPHI